MPPFSNHGVVWVGQDLKAHPGPPPAVDKDTFPRAGPACPWTLPGTGQPNFSGHPVPEPHHLPSYLIGNVFEPLLMVLWETGSVYFFK